MTVPAYDPDLPVETRPSADPLAAIRGVRAATPRPADRGHAAVHRRRGRRAGLRRDLELRAERARCPDRDPVGVPLAAFIETDLVLVFDHLTHTLSAIASLHTETPNLEARYRIAEAAIFEALERTSRPGAAELNGVPPARPSARDGGRAPARRRSPAAGSPVETSLGRDEYIHAVTVAKDAIAAGEAIQVVLARRQSFDLPADPSTGATLDGIGLYRALRRVNPSPYLFFVRTPGLRGGRRLAGAAPPGRGRPADDPPDRRDAARAARTPARTRSSPRSSSATRRSGPST